MTTPESRLDKIESQLTPKQWSIRLADEQRQYPSAGDYLRAVVAKPLQEPLKWRGFEALTKQAEERYPGNRPEDMESREEFRLKLCREFHTFNVIQAQVNVTVTLQTKSLALRVMVMLWQLHALIFQDAFGEANKNERQAMLVEFAASVIEDSGGRSPVDLEAGQPFNVGHSILVKEWGQHGAALLGNIFALRAAVQRVQEEHFDGHPILFRDLERELSIATQIIEDAVTAFNDYLIFREATFPQEQADAAKGQEGPAIDIEAVRASVGGKASVAVAMQWVKEAQDYAADDSQEDAGERDKRRWDRLREFAGVRT
jgi:hypothetical protein